MKLKIDFDLEHNMSPTKIKYIKQFRIGTRVLDVGCGLGQYSKYLTKKGVQVIAIDIDNPIKEKNGFIFCKASGDALPFKDKSFDTVLIFDVLEHIKNDEKALSELQRVAKRIIGSVPNKDDESLHKYNLTFKHHIDKTHFREYTLYEIKTMLNRFDFDVIKINPEGPISSLIVEDFIRNSFLRMCVILPLKVLRKVGLIEREKMYADIFWVASARQKDV